MTMSSHKFIASFVVCILIISSEYVHETVAAKAGFKVDVPRIGVYRKNYRDQIYKIIAETINTEVSLPLLRFEDHTWEGKSIELVCNASYPVVWRYNGLGAPAIHTFTSRKLISETETVYQFSAHVVFTHTNAKQTGNYSCESIENPEVLHSYVYVFVPGSSLFLTDIEETETVIIDPNDPWVFLPCSVSDNDVTAVLIKQGPSGTSQIIKTGQNLSYDSKTGFRMKWRGYSSPAGKYFCVAQNSRNVEQLEINLEFPHKPESTGNALYWSTPSKRKLVRFITDKRNNRIVCCSNKNKRPTMKSTGCSSLSDCEIRRKYLDAKKCPPTCEQNIVNVGRTCVAYELGEWRDTGILQCSYDETNNSEPEYFVFAKYADLLITNFEEMPPINQILKIYSDDSSTPGKLSVSCHAHSFFFSHGLKWGIQKPNGEFNFLPEAHFPSPTNIEVDKRENIGNKFHCFAPLWNSPNEWKSTSILIK